MAIARPISKTIISTAQWGWPITDEVNRLTTNDAARTPTAWTNLTLQNGWVVAGGMHAQYRKVGDMVQIRGSVASGPASTTIATLPAGFWIAKLMQFRTFAYVGSAWAICAFDITTDGRLQYTTPANPSYLPIDMQYSITP